MPDDSRPKPEEHIPSTTAGSVGSAEPIGSTASAVSIDPEAPGPTSVHLPPHILERELGSEIVLLNLETELYFGLDEVGARIWHSLTTLDSVAAAVEELTRVFDAEPETLEADVNRLVGELLERGLLAPGSRDPTPAAGS